MTDTELQTTNGVCKVFEAKTTDQIMAVMRQEDADAERQKILDSMTPAFRAKLDYFENWLRNEVHHALRSRYELGLVALEMYEDEKNGGKLYGTDAIGRICKVLQWDDGVIRAALHFVRTYSRDDLERLCHLVLPSGAPLTWSHVRYLLPVKDGAKRVQLLERTVAEGWSCKELEKEVRAAVAGPNDGRGRPPAVPKDFDDAVAQQLEAAAQWDRKYGKVWGHDKHSLAAQVAKLAPEEVTKERVQEAWQLAQQLRIVADEAATQAKAAEQIARGLERLLEQCTAASKEGAVAGGDGRK